MKNNSFIPAIRNGPNNNENGPNHELDHLLPRHRKITRIGLAELALQKYLKNGSGIDFTDVQWHFGNNKSKSQRILKRSCTPWLDKDGNKRDPILFRLSTRTKPQKFFPTSIKADIIEDFKKRENEPIGATGVNLSISADPISNAVGYQKAQNFLDVLTQLPFYPLHIHRSLLKLSIDKEYYQTLTQKAALINRAKRFEEPIGRRYARFNSSRIFSQRCSLTSLLANAWWLARDNWTSKAISLTLRRRLPSRLPLAKCRAMQWRL